MDVVKEDLQRDAATEEAADRCRKQLKEEEINRLEPVTWKWDGPLMPRWIYCFVIGLLNI